MKSESKSNSKKSEFLVTFAAPAQVPELFSGPFLKGHREPRIAVVGRSNVGKSTLINALLGAKLAQISKQPGKTRAIHFYQWKLAGRIIADLPGYGYARASWSERERWEKFIQVYFQSDENLQGILLLLDARHGPTEADLEAISFFRPRVEEITFVFSKADTLKTQSERASRKKEATDALRRIGVPDSSVFWVSSQTQLGMKELSKYLREDL